VASSLWGDRRGDSVSEANITIPNGNFIESGMVIDDNQKVQVYLSFTLFMFFVA